ncbi:547_t:CDS:2, partial [Scutellospora calospora]
FTSNIQMLTDALYYWQCRECASLELDPTKFEYMIESINPQLKGFFRFMVNAIVPMECSAYNIQEAKKTIVGLCYQIAGLYNKFVNQYKLEVGLYLMASGATWEAINTISSLEYSACAKTIEEFRKKIYKEHTIKIENHFMNYTSLFHVYNIDNYHAIHKNRRPDTVSTSDAKHFATCVAKPVLKQHSVPIMFNEISIHNSENVESSRICWYLLKRYTGIFDISYSDYRSLQILQGRSVITEYDPIETLTIHSYADNIIERKEE